MHTTSSSLTGWHERRAWFAVLLVGLALFVDAPAQSAFGHLLMHALHIQHPSPGILGEGTYGVQMTVRLLWDWLLWAAVCGILKKSVTGFPFRDSSWLRHLAVGLATGLLVMLATVLGIWALRSANVSSSGQTLIAALGNGFWWLVLELVGAFGEEILNRAVILITAERFLGWRGAIVTSGLMFSGSHLHNPGASSIWLMRLFLQGSVLAYAIYRTQSLWWSVGYHTGWNWISAPLFGAAGSGYLDEGHVLNFQPHGSTLITGGSIGPEGSLLAFGAVLAALVLLTISTPSTSASRPS